MSKKTKIVLDADVIIHFSKGGCLSILPNIFNGYEYIVLSYVRDEIKGDIRNQLDNQIYFLRNIRLEEFNPSGDMMREYAKLNRLRGKGESACMAYCKYNNDVLGSSNLRDIADYCKENGITYLTTMDFLYYAIRNKAMSMEEAKQFIRDVLSKGSKLPDIDIEKFVSKVEI